MTKTKVELYQESNLDLKVVNTARASFNTKHEVWHEKSDARLLQYLAENNHWTPFAQGVFKLPNAEIDISVLTDPYLMAGINILKVHKYLIISGNSFIVAEINISAYTLIQLLIRDDEPLSCHENGLYAIHQGIINYMPHTAKAFGFDISDKSEFLDEFKDNSIRSAEDAVTLYHEMPLFVARQWFKHKIGFVRNELSRRYVRKDFEFYKFDYIRKQSKDNKQASIYEPIEDTDAAIRSMEAITDTCLDTYNEIVKAGGAGEQARAILPQNMIVNFYETAIHRSMYDRVLKQRLDPSGHVQRETYEHAKLVEAIITNCK